MIKLGKYFIDKINWKDKYWDAKREYDRISTELCYLKGLFLTEKGWKTYNGREFEFKNMSNYYFKCYKFDVENLTIRESSVKLIDLYGYEDRYCKTEAEALERLNKIIGDKNDNNDIF